MASPLRIVVRMVVVLSIFPAFLLLRIKPTCHGRVFQRPWQDKLTKPDRRATMNRRFHELLNGDWLRFRSNPVGYDFNSARAGFSTSRDIEHGRDLCLPGRDRHRAMVMRFAIENVMGRGVSDAHDRIVSHVRGIVAVVSPYSKTIELTSSDLHGGAASKCRRHRSDLWPPGIDWPPVRRRKLDVLRRSIRDHIHDLARGQH